jgi:hypothetical protein
VYEINLSDELSFNQRTLLMFKEVLVERELIITSDDILSLEKNLLTKNSMNYFIDLELANLSLAEKHKKEIFVSDANFLEIFESYQDKHQFFKDGRKLLIFPVHIYSKYWIFLFHITSAKILFVVDPCNSTNSIKSSKIKMLGKYLGGIEKLCSLQTKKQELNNCGPYIVKSIGLIVRWFSKEDMGDIAIHNLEKEILNLNINSSDLKNTWPLILFKKVDTIFTSFHRLDRIFRLKSFETKFLKIYNSSNSTDQSSQKIQVQLLPILNGYMVNNLRHKKKYLVIYFSNKSWNIESISGFIVAKLKKLLQVSCLKDFKIETFDLRHTLKISSKSVEEKLVIEKNLIRCLIEYYVNQTAKNPSNFNLNHCSKWNSPSAILVDKIYSKINA